MSNVNSQRSLFGFLVAGAIALLIMSAGLYWFFAKSPVNLLASTSSPNAAIFVSKLAPVTVSLLTNPERLQSLERQGELSQLKTSLLAKSGINYKQDIQPWLGNEITLSVTTVDIDRDAENGRQPGYLMALATDKPEKSREFLDLLFSRRVLAGANLAVEEYEGVKLISDSQPQPDSLAGAVVDGFVLFANDRSVLRDAINNVQAPDLNLSSSSQYQKATQQLPKASLATAFLNLPAVAEWQGLELPEAIFHSQIISLSLNSKGLLAETNFLTDSEIIPASAPLSQTVKALEYIPDAAGLVISSSHLDNLGKSDLAQLWTQVKTALSGSGTDAISTLVKPLAEVQKSQGINLAEDIFNWVKGEYALAVLPHAGEGAAGWVFVVEKLEDVPEGISRLDAIASSRGLSISSFNLNQQKIFAWTELNAVSKETETKASPAFAIEAKVQGVHTTLGNYEIFASNLETLNEVITTKKGSLISDDNFQDSIATIPQPNQGYVYLDWTKSKTLLERQLPILQLVEVVGKPFFQNLRSLTISSYGHEKGLLKGGILFRLDH
ncbi:MULTISPECIES: DUF3352 domain-containing protein [unclassified Nodularia (in: cyanobacteria)]|uniref:DUF3352 domain-containing protein n=1 Tax=unclassified Nodularia (in: cyanobacteria) TaxID=2656917 RepID=UPI001882DA54|nr:MULTISPECIES: DUF3352 domain-containing protein [unclassified Nodularia (in: cyanobacteria)]MBE9199360.1 DUF3352 domain-containing protein [Nodularia sp. LEGE 06071]MCC2694124.1 DUF3352 domain-containing protein [Nodularia sp. LEGE 04288]